MSNLAEIKAAIPHRAPFLFVDEIVERSDDRIVCRKTFSGSEFFYAGHYPDFPLTPGVILCEAAMQAGAILLAQKLAPAQNKVPVATRANNVRFKRMVRPGETIQIEVDFVERLAEAFFLKAKVSCAGEVACRLEFACTLAAISPDVTPREPRTF
ncbi:MAG TPA: 3-hydroxyacyl-ACP dehydratase FabZ family protein [Pirellulales bacterium]|jgi:3-hydroxyacyl-[acyl-carrier-protein] dehydratase|nr:3-hydroxyacyl-ACP dehydratase FabZ family protein [Pirellulales bacterium]